MRILFISDNFPPEGNAPANRTFEHCREWVQSGAEVTVITCQPNFPKGKIYSGYRNRLLQTEIVEGIRVVRVWSYITPNRGTIRRSMDYFSFFITSLVATLFYKTDIIIATSPQLFSAVSGFLASSIKRVPWVMEVRDLWPASIRAVNASNNKRILRNLAKLVAFLYRKADKIVVVTDSFKEKITEQGIDPDKITVVKNGVLSSRYFPGEADPALMNRFGLKAKFVVGYIGTHGMAHGLEILLDAAAKTQDPNLHFLLVGDGALKSRLLARRDSLALKNVTMLTAISRDQVPIYLRLLNVAVVPLKRKKTFLSVLPSKIFENAATGKPILLGVEGEAKELIERYSAGLCFQPENVDDFLEKLNYLKGNKRVYEQCSVGALELASSFDRKRLAFVMLQSLASLVGEPNILSKTKVT
jgi:glycosyltransferase involved in cell wall biosynthesis